MEFHLRITAPHDSSSETIINAFISKFKPLVYIISREISKENVHHWHGHIEYKSLPKKQTMSDFFKKNGLAGKYYHKNLTKDSLNNKLYVTKDLDIFLHNLTEDELEELLELTEEINEDKKKDPKLKLLDYFRENGCGDLGDMCNTVARIYIQDYDKLPPSRALTMAYVEYCSLKLGQNTPHLKGYRDSFF